MSESVGARKCEQHSNEGRQPFQIPKHTCRRPVQPLFENTGFLRTSHCNANMALNSHEGRSRTQSVLEFSKYLQQVLGQSVAEIPTLVTHLEALASSPLHDGSHEERLQLHQIGVKLWNKCRLDDNDESTHQKTLRAQGISHETLRPLCSR